MQHRAQAIFTSRPAVPIVHNTRALAVAEWSQTWFMGESLLLSNKTAKVNMISVCKDVGAAVPYLSCVRKLSYNCRATHTTWGDSCCRAGECLISLSNSGMNLSTLLHELAHHFNLGAGKADPHGPLFVETYLYLLSQYGLGMAQHVEHARRHAKEMRLI